MTAAELAIRLQGRKTGAGWLAKCPGHEDRNASLSLSEGDDGRVLLKCHAGCSSEAVVGAIGIRMADLFPPPRDTAAPARKTVAAYPYRDESGRLLFEAVRFEPKDFRQRQPDGVGGWKWNLAGVRLVPFRLPETLAAIAEGRTVFICEGEKDCLTLVVAGFAATCNPMGAGKWRPEFSDLLRGADAIIIPDNDEPGRKHAEAVAASLHGKAARVRVLTLPSELNGRRVKDAADYFAAGGEAAGLDELAEASPDWNPKLELSPIEPSDDDEVEDDDIGETPIASLRGELLNIITGRAEAIRKKAKVESLVARTLRKLGRFYRLQEDECHATSMYFNAELKRLDLIKSDRFGSWLSRLIGINQEDGFFRVAHNACLNEAMTGPESLSVTPEAFWASRPGAFYLSNGPGRMAKMTAAGVEVVDNGTDGVLFYATRTLDSWTLASESVDPFKAATLFRNFHSSDPHGQTMFRLWAYSLVSNPKTKPPLVLTGPIGSGKTRAIRGLCELFGIPAIVAAVETAKADYFWPNVHAGGITILDNADTSCKWLPDALATAATGGVSNLRKLYTNGETVTLKPNGWVCLTSAVPTFASDAGLADRLIVVRMARAETPTEDGLLSEEIAKCRNGALTHVCRTLARALADTAPVPLRVNERHPDFGEFAVRIGRALDIEAEAIAALKNAEADKSRLCLESDTVAPAVLEYVRRHGSFEGDARTLLTNLRGSMLDVPEDLTPLGLGKRLNNLLPHLGKVLGVAKVKSVHKTSVYVLSE